jgi:hypothetical protein
VRIDSSLYALSRSGLKQPIDRRRRIEDNHRA